MVAIGALGVLAARRGDRVAADSLIARLGAIETPYIFGREVLWQGRIAAALGQCERAVGFLTAAARKGMGYNAFFEDPLLARIANCAAFKRFLQPDARSR